MTYSRTFQILNLLSILLILSGCHEHSSKKDKIVGLWSSKEISDDIVLGGNTLYRSDGSFIKDIQVQSLEYSKTFPFVVSGEWDIVDGRLIEKNIDSEMLDTNYEDVFSPLIIGLSESYLIEELTDKILILKDEEGETVYSRLSDQQLDEFVNKMAMRSKLNSRDTEPSQIAGVDITLRESTLPSAVVSTIAPHFRSGEESMLVDRCYLSSDFSGDGHVDYAMRVFSNATMKLVIVNGKTNEYFEFGDVEFIQRISSIDQNINVDHGRGIQTYIFWDGLKYVWGGGE